MHLQRYLIVEHLAVPGRHCLKTPSQQLENIEAESNNYNVVSARVLVLLHLGCESAVCTRGMGGDVGGYGTSVILVMTYYFQHTSYAVLVMAYQS